MAGERVVLAQPIASAGGRVISSPFQFFVDGSDQLRIEGWNTASGAILEVTYRFAKFDGEVVVERRDLALTADRVSAELDVPLGKGYLVNMSVFVIGASPLIGQTFTCIKLIRGMGAAAIVVGLLLQGYVTAEQGLGWPGSPIVDSISGGGYIRAFQGTDPPAGSVIVETVPTGARWRILMVRADFTTDATAGNRRVYLLLDNLLAGVAASAQYIQQGPSLTKQYYWNSGMPQESTVTDSAYVAGLPGSTVLLAGWKLDINADGRTAGDNFSAPYMVIEEWLEVNA